MKENLIKITGEQDLFYDNEDRLYRCRMHCPYCAKYSGCRCFDTLEKAEDFMYNEVDFVCSSKCFLKSMIDDQGIDDIRDTMWEMGIFWRLKWYIFRFTGYISEKDAYKVINEIDIDYDSVEGESC